MIHNTHFNDFNFVFGDFTEPIPVENDNFELDRSSEVHELQPVAHSTMVSINL